MAQSASVVQAIAAIERIRPWRRGMEQAPHKPLLLLLALRRVQLGEPRLTDFRSIELPLRELIREYSPGRSRVHPEYPFWRLQHDGLWEVLDADTYSSRKSNTDPPVSELRNRPAIGGLPANLDATLRSSPAALCEIANLIARRFFPEGEAQQVLDSVGFDMW